MIERFCGLWRCLSPGIALFIMQLFRCVDIEGVSYLAADMRLVCYTSEWAG